MLRAKLSALLLPASRRKPVICRGGKSRSTYTSRPVSHIPDSKQAIHLSEEEKGALKRPHKYR
jgi:hypothetical protein